MSKKDYIMVGSRLKMLIKTNKIISDNLALLSAKQVFENYKLTINELIYFFIQDFESDNPRFDRSRFLDFVNK